MKHLVCFIPLVLLAACATGSHQMEVNALFDRPPQIESQEEEVDIALIVGNGGRRYVTCEIHGKKLLFMVDTGSVATIVDSAVARYEHLTTIPVPYGMLYGGGGGFSSTVGRIEELKLSGVVISGLPVVFADQTGWNKRELATQKRSIDGIFGSDLLVYLGASIDYSTNKMKIKRPNKAPVPTATSVTPAADAPVAPAAAQL